MDCEQELLKLHEILAKAQVAIMHLQVRELALVISIGQLLNLTKEQQNAFRELCDKNFKDSYNDLLMMRESEDPALAAKLSAEID